jgi:hypothetical protein
VEKVPSWCVNYSVPVASGYLLRRFWRVSFLRRMGSSAARAVESWTIATI